MQTWYLKRANNEMSAQQRLQSDNFRWHDQEHAHASKETVGLQSVVTEESSPRTPAVHLTTATARTGTGQYSFILPPVRAVHRTVNGSTSNHHFTQTTGPKSLSVTPSLRGGAVLHGTKTGGPSLRGGQPCAQVQQVKAARKRELARRHLSNSLQGSRTVLPVLRRVCSMCAPLRAGLGRQESASMIVDDKAKRDTQSLEPRKPPHDLPVSTARRRSHSLVEGSASCSNDPTQRHSLPLPLPHPPLENRVSLAALIHELNATMRSPFRNSYTEFSDIDDDDEAVVEFDYENGLDPDLCPRIKGRGKDSCSTPQNRALTPALRKLNRRKLSSRIRTQHWVDQIEGDERRNERRKKLAEETNMRESPPPIVLEFRGNLN